MARLRDHMSTATDRPTAPARRFETASSRVLAEEILVVLSLSLLYSAVASLLRLLEAPVNRGVAVALFPNVAVARQFVDILFGLAPVALVLYLVRRSGEGLEPFGLGTTRPARDLGWGIVGGVAVGAIGLALYLAAISLNVNRFVVPVPPLGQWWTETVLVLGSAQNALLEEVVVVGYLIPRLRQVGWGGASAVAASAILRGSYHLYQGWGGFAGNLLLGIAFGWAFLRWRRTWPLVVAHFLVDVLAGFGYIAFRGDCFFDLCIPR